MQWPKEVGGIKIRYKLCSQGTRSLEEEKAMVKIVENVVIDSQRASWRCLKAKH